MGFMMDVTFPNNHIPAVGKREASATKASIATFLNSLSHEFYNNKEVQELKYFVNSNEGMEPETHAYYPIGQFATDRTGYTAGDSMIIISKMKGKCTYEM